MTAPVITPTTPEELELLLKDTGRMETLAREGKVGQVIQDYIKAFNAKNSALQRNVADQIESTKIEMARDAMRERNLPFKMAAGMGVHPEKLAKRSGAAWNKHAPGVPLDAQFSDLAEVFQAHWHNLNNMGNVTRRAELQAKRDSAERISNSFSTVVPDAGGALIPEEFRAEVLQQALETSVVRPRAQVIPMNSQTLAIPTVDETTHVGSVYGGIVAYWTEEAANATESQASFGQIKLEPKKLVIYCEAPNELVADAPAFGAWLDRNLPGATAFYEDMAFLTGNGTGQPLGVLNASGAVVVTRTTTNKLLFQDVVNLYARMLPQSINTAVWLVAPDAVPSLLSMVVPTGGTTDFVGPPVWLLGQSIAGAPMGTILGRPVIITEKTAAWKTKGDLMFVDFNQYGIGDRQTMALTSSPHYKFQSQKTAYALTERVDGRPLINSALSPANGSTNTLSPYVILNT